MIKFNRNPIVFSKLTNIDKIFDDGRTDKNVIKMQRAFYGGNGIETNGISRKRGTIIDENRRRVARIKKRTYGTWLRRDVGRGSGVLRFLQSHCAKSLSKVQRNGSWHQWLIVCTLLERTKYASARRWIWTDLICHCTRAPLLLVLLPVLLLPVLLRWLWLPCRRLLHPTRLVVVPVIVATFTIVVISSSATASVLIVAIVTLIVPLIILLLLLSSAIVDMLRGWSIGLRCSSMKDLRCGALSVLADAIFLHKQHWASHWEAWEWRSVFYNIVNVIKLL